MWESDECELMELTDGHGFDTIILSDVLFNHSQNEKLAKSCASLLSSTKSSCMVVFFSHHRPWLADHDMKFFEYMKEFGISGSEIFTKYVGPMWEEDRGPAEVRGKNTAVVYMYKYCLLCNYIF